MNCLFHICMETVRCICVTVRGKDFSRWQHSLLLKPSIIKSLWKIGVMCTEKNRLVKCDRAQCTNILKILMFMMLIDVYLPHVFLGSVWVYSRQHAFDDWRINAIMVNVFNGLVLALIARSLSINCPTLHLNSRHHSHQPLRGHARKYQSNSSDFIREILGRRVRSQIKLQIKGPQTSRYCYFHIRAALNRLRAEYCR